MNRNALTEERLQRHLPDTDDVTLLALKGHLLIEERVNDIIEKMFRDPQAIRNAGLRIHQKISILRASYDVSGMLDAFAAANTLNMLRNRLAHHLEHADVARLAEDFVGNIARTCTEAEGELLARLQEGSLHARLRLALVTLYGDLEVVLNMTTCGGVAPGLVLVQPK